MKKFLSACRSAARRIPIVAVKGGSSVRGRELIATHTGRPSGGDRVYDTAFRRAGGIRVESIRELLSSAQAFARGLLPRGDRLAVVTNSGGMGVLVADDLARHGARLVEELSPGLRERLAPCVTAYGGSVNPVCIDSDADVEGYVQVLGLLLDAGAVDTVLVVMALCKGYFPGQVVERWRDAAAARLVALGGGSQGLAADRDREALLSAYGLPINPTRVAATRPEVTAAAEVLGFPVALRAASRGAGCRPGTASVRNPCDLPGAYRRLGGDGTLVTLQHVVRDVRYELKLGVQTDVEFGPYLFLGTGGLPPGVPENEMVMLPPLNRLLARRLIDNSGLAARMALQGNEAEQLEELLVRLSQLVVDFPVIRPLQLNPLTLAQGRFCVQASQLVLEDRDIQSPHQLATAPYPNQYEFRETALLCFYWGQEMFAHASTRSLTRVILQRKSQLFYG